MKYGFWFVALLAATAVEAMVGLACEALGWFAMRARRWSDAAEIEMLLARAERAIAAGRERRARARARGGAQP